MFGLSHHRQLVVAGEWESQSSVVPEITPQHALAGTLTSCSAAQKREEERGLWEGERGYDGKGIGTKSIMYAYEIMSE